MPGRGRHSDAEISSTGLYAAVAAAALGGAAVKTVVDNYRGWVEEDYLLNKAFMDLDKAYYASPPSARAACLEKIRYWQITAAQNVNWDKESGDSTPSVISNAPRAAPSAIDGARLNAARHMKMAAGEDLLHSTLAGDIAQRRGPRLHFTRRAVPTAA